MILEHYLAVAALIPTSPLYHVYFGTVPDKPKYPYVVVWGDLGKEVGESLGDRVDQLDLRPRITYVGTDFKQCLWVADRLREALNRATPVVAGWTPSKLRQQALQSVTTDLDVALLDGSNPVFAVDEYPFTSTPN